MRNEDASAFVITFDPTSQSDSDSDSKVALLMIVNLSLMVRVALTILTTGVTKMGGGVVV